MEVFGYIVKIDTSWYLKSFTQDSVNRHGYFGSTVVRAVVSDFGVTSKSRESYVFPSKAQAAEIACQIGGTVFRLHGELAEEAK